MLRPRIQPCLLLHQGGLFKTAGFREPRYVGDPINAIKIFNEKEADELIVFDIDATLEGRGPDIGMIRNIAAECRMPLCYGGGVKTAKQAKEIVAAGVEKVAISSAAVELPGLIDDMALELGSQSVVVVIDAKKNRLGQGYHVRIRNGRENTGLSPEDLARDAERRGAGEVVINSIDRDGGMAGYDLELASRIRSATSRPVTVLGGAGSLEHMSDLFQRCGVVGAAAGSLFVFKGALRGVLINYPTTAQKDHVTRGVRS